MLDFNSEIELWTRAGHIKVHLKKGLDIRRLDKLISEAILGTGETAFCGRNAIATRCGVSGAGVASGPEGHARAALLGRQGVDLPRL